MSIFDDCNFPILGRTNEESSNVATLTVVTVTLTLLTPDDAAK